MHSQKQTIHDIDVVNKRVLVRVDFNVPLDEHRQITDDTRIKAAIPTIQYLLDRGAKVILMTHLGRPEGHIVEALRLAPVASRLSILLERPVKVTRECVGPSIKELVSRIYPGQVILLENLRFHPEEEQNDRGFASQLAALGDIYVNDAFGTAHRAHASTEGITHFLPAVAGFLMEKELKSLGSLLERPRRPFVTIIGGAKVTEKMALLNHLIDRIDLLLVGGGMANAFLKAQGYAIGASRVEESQVDAARDALAKARQRALTILLPIDVVVAERCAIEAPRKIVTVDQVPADWQILDIGPRTIAAFQEALDGVRTILWNGTLGVAELPPFATGTHMLLDFLVTATQRGATTIVGGGDSVAAVTQAKVGEKLTHVSTGGGATLKFLAGQPLPGVLALQEKTSSHHRVFREFTHH